MAEIPGRNGGTLIPQEPGKPAPPGAGRPKNPFKQMIRDIADAGDNIEVIVEGYLVDERGNPYGDKVSVLAKIPGVAAIVQKAFKQAAKGDHHARKWLVEAGYGKNVTIGDDPENPLGGGFVLLLPENKR